MKISHLRTWLASLIFGIAIPMAFSDEPCSPAHQTDASSLCQTVATHKVHKEIREILQSEDFNQKDTHVTLGLKRAIPWIDFNLPDMTDQHASSGVVKVITFIIDKLPWIALAILIVFSLWQRHRWIPLFRAWFPVMPQDHDVTHLQICIDKERLPDDIPLTARTLWQKGEARSALSLLYRGALDSLQVHAKVSIPDSATEYENLKAIEKTQPQAVISDFKIILRAWQTMAYADCPPSDFAHLLVVFERRFVSRGES